MVEVIRFFIVYISENIYILKIFVEIFFCYSIKLGREVNLYVIMI